MFTKPANCKIQQALMKELLIVVDSRDQISAFSTKLDCHKILSYHSNGILHRAFSLFLFERSTGEILLQKRSKYKFTFPELWSNTMCSHPILNREINEINGPSGVLNAVRRRFNIEMGYQMPDSILGTLRYIGRVRYSAQSSAEYYENEVDYIIFGELEQEKYLMEFNKDEIENLKFCSINNLRKIAQDKPSELTPWLKKIVQQNYIPQWLSLYHSGRPNLDTIISI